MARRTKDTKTGESPKENTKFQIELMGKTTLEKAELITKNLYRSFEGKKPILTKKQEREIYSSLKDTEVRVFESYMKHYDKIIANRSLMYYYNTSLELISHTIKSKVLGLHIHKSLFGDMMKLKEKTPNSEQLNKSLQEIIDKWVGLIHNGAVGYILTHDKKTGLYELNVSEIEKEIEEKLKEFEATLSAAKTMELSLNAMTSKYGIESLVPKDIKKIVENYKKNYFTSSFEVDFFSNVGFPLPFYDTIKPYPGWEEKNLFL